MRYRKLSPTGDYTFGNGQKDFYRDEPAAVGQACQTRLLLWLGEWFLDVEEGTPWLQGALGKHPNGKVLADRTIQDRALGTEGLTDIKNYESEVEPVNRAMSVNFDIDTIYGPTAVVLDSYTSL